MSELVTDEVVDVLARRQYAAMVRVDKYPGNAPTWEDFSGPFKDRIIAGARAELEELAPLIARQALETAADDWQRGEWANAPRRPDRVQERIANGQHVGDWLRSRAARQTVTTEGLT